MNCCSHFVEMFKVQFFYLKCYNQGFIMHYAIDSNSYSNDKVLFTNKKDNRMWKKYPDPLAKLQFSQVSFDFSTKWCNYGQEAWNAPDAYPTFSGLLWVYCTISAHFNPSFLSHWVFSIKIAVELYHLSFQQQKIVCLDSKMEIQEQGHQGNTNWPRQWNARGIFNFSNLLQTKRLPWSFSTNLSWILLYQKPVDICLALD